MPASRVRTLLGTKLWDEYFKFCFDRNPWDRALSLYSWRARDRGETFTSLLAFLRHEHGKRLSEGKTCKLTNFGIYSIGGDIAVDRVGTYENLDSELERIAARLGLPEKIELPIANMLRDKDRRHYRDVMGPEERSIVAQACCREIAHLRHNL
jgi:hypothetical protein